MIERYKQQRNLQGHSAIAKSIDNTAVDNIIATHKELNMADTEEEQQLDQEQIESAAAAAIEKVFK